MLVGSSLPTIAFSLQMLWAVSGLILTVICTFLQPALFLPITWGEFVLRPIEGSFQVGAVLFTACMGGRMAAVVAQLSYLLLGLVGLNVFYQGGGVGYLRSPAFGYLIGFVVGGAVCGHLAFTRQRSLEQIGLSCLVGLVLIHFVGIAWLMVSGFPNLNAIISQIEQYSVQPFAGQILVSCAIALLAYLLRFILLY